MSVITALKNFMRNSATAYRTQVALRAQTAQSNQPPGVYVYQHDSLVDAETNAVLALSSYPATIVFLNGSMIDTKTAVSVQYPNYATSFFLLREKPEKLPEWSWNQKDRVFVPTSPLALTESLRTKAYLARTKQEAITRIMRQITQARFKVTTGIEFQETVYLTKKQQAQAFKDAGYDESSILQYPYVLQYADFAGMSLKEAADEILFKANLDDEYLASTELLRLKYFSKIRDVTSAEELRPILEEFHRDCYL